MVVTRELLVTDWADSPTVVDEMFDTVSAKLMTTWDSGLFDEVSFTDLVLGIGNFLSELDLLDSRLILLNLFLYDLFQQVLTLHGSLNRAGAFITKWTSMLDFPC